MDEEKVAKKILERIFLSHKEVTKLLEENNLQENKKINAIIMEGYISLIHLAYGEATPMFCANCIIKQQTKDGIPKGMFALDELEQEKQNYMG